MKFASKYFDLSRLYNMISSLKQPAIGFNGLEAFRPKGLSPSRKISVLPPLHGIGTSRRSSIGSLSKPLYVSKIESFQTSDRSSSSLDADHQNQKQEKRDLITCKAYEADNATPIDGAHSRSEAARKLKIGVYFATWWTLNVIFNIYNKKVLNAYPFPWLTSTLSLAAGSIIMLISWAFRIAETPKTDVEFWKALFPVSSIGFMFYD